jgi:hypothetical protein
LSDDDVTDLRELVGELAKDDAEARASAAVAIAGLMAGNGKAGELYRPTHQPDRRVLGDFWQYRWRRAKR